MQKERKINECGGKKENGDGWSGTKCLIIGRGKGEGADFGVSGNFFCEGFCVEWRDWAFDEAKFLDLMLRIFGRIKKSLIK